MVEVRKLKVLDLFSGIGGFSLGLERTGGFEAVAFCEIDEHCRKVLNKHWPDVLKFKDIRDLKPKKGDYEICAGGVSLSRHIDSRKAKRNRGRTKWIMERVF